MKITLVLLLSINFCSICPGYVQTPLLTPDKIKPFLPLIDKIFNDYAEKNHFHGFAFGTIQRCWENYQNKKYNCRK